MKQFFESIGNNILTITNVFDNISDLIYLMEVDGDSFRYVYLNPSAMKVMNINENIQRGRIDDVLPKYFTELLKHKYKQLQFTKKPIRFIETLKTNGGEFVGETTLNPIITDDGQCRYVVIIIRDLSEGKQKERELKETQRTLDRKQKRLNSLIENNGDAVFVDEQNYA